jgi:hypothetical protein
MKLLQKNKCMQLLRKYGFEDIDEIALVKLFLTIETLVKNLLDNTIYVMESVKAKTITPTHFAMVLHIIKTHGTNVNHLMQGGGAVMPSEFFNTTPSGSYAIDNNVFSTGASDASFARPALLAYSAILTPGVQLGGGKKKGTVALLDVDTLKGMIVEYKKTTKKDFMMSSKSYDIIIRSVTENIENLVSAASKMRKPRPTKLTKALLFATLKKHSHEFIHMCTVWN